MVPRRRRDGRGRLLVRGRDPPRGRDLVPAPRRALHVPGVLGARAPGGCGGNGRLLVPRPGSRGPPPRGVRRLRPRQPRPVRGREGDRGGGDGARRRPDPGRRRLPPSRRRVLRPALLRSVPGAAAGDRLLRRPRQPRLRDPGRQALLRRLHPAPQRSPRPATRVLLLARAGGRADDRARHEPDHGEAPGAVRALAHRDRPPPGELPARLPAPRDVLVRARLPAAPGRVPARASRPALHRHRGRHRLQRPRPSLRAHPADRRRRLRHDRGRGSRAVRAPAHERLHPRLRQRPAQLHPRRGARAHADPAPDRRRGPGDRRAGHHQAGGGRGRSPGLRRRRLASEGLGGARLRRLALGGGRSHGVRRRPSRPPRASISSVPGRSARRCCGSAGRGTSSSA